MMSAKKIQNPKSIIRGPSLVLGAHEGFSKTEEIFELSSGE